MVENSLGRLWLEGHPDDLQLNKIRVYYQALSHVALQRMHFLKGGLSYGTAYKGIIHSWI